jgi:hypothetical protein
MRAVTVVVAFGVFCAMPALAKEEQSVAPGKRIPFQVEKARTNELSFDTYHSGFEIVRQRTPGKEYATFSAEPASIERGAEIVFEIRSVGKANLVRWRCVAKTDVAECLGAPVRVRYLGTDEKIVLTANLVPALDRTVAAR